MDETALLLAFGPVADAGPSRLEIEEIGAGRDLAIAVLPRQPDLNVIGFGRGEAQVA
jgi:hypothetical protein